MGASIITKQGSYALLQRGKRYYKVQQLIHYKMGQSLLHRGGGHRFITNWSKYYKLGQELLQNWAGNSIHSASIVIAKYGRYIE